MGNRARALQHCIQRPGSQVILKEIPELLLKNSRLAADFKQTSVLLDSSLKVTHHCPTDKTELPSFPDGWHF